MWKLYYSKRAQKQLRKLDPGVARILVQWLNRNVDGATDPRAKGRSLTGDLSEKWRYRVGDYRVLCEIRDEELIVLAVEIGHRRHVYR